MLEPINQVDSTFLWHVKFPVINVITEEELLSAWTLAELFAESNKNKFNATIEKVVRYNKKVIDGHLVGIEVIYKKISSC